MIFLLYASCMKKKALFDHFYFFSDYFFIFKETEEINTFKIMLYKLRQNMVYIGIAVEEL